VLAIIILLTTALTALAIWHGTLAWLSRQFAGRPTLLDRASTEPMVALFLLPVTTVLTSLVINFAGPGADLLDEWAPNAKVSANLVAFEVIAPAVMLSLLVPLVALHKVVEARHGRGVALFDPDIGDAVFQAALADRWSRLRAARRRWLSSQRLAALGDDDSPAGVAWPTRTGHLPPARTRWLSRLPWLAASVAVLCLLVAAASVAHPADRLPDPNPTALAVAYGLAPASLTALVIWLCVYRRLLREQSEADLLRLAASSRPTALPPTPPLTLAHRWWLLRQALAR